MRYRVEVGRAGGSRVVGVDCGAGHDDLIGNGTDVVVADLGELVMAGRVADEF